jgi:hypothetical protein
MPVDVEGVCIVGYEFSLSLSTHRSKVPFELHEPPQSPLLGPLVLALLHLQPQKMGLWAAGTGSIVAILLVESVAALI